MAKRSHVIYKVNCSECDEFYIGLTNRRLETRLHEHFTNENSALYRHSFLTDHAINYSNPNILGLKYIMGPGRHDTECVKSLNKQKTHNLLNMQN